MWITCIFLFLMGVMTGGCLVATGLWYVLSFFFHDPSDKKKLQGGVPGCQQLPQQPTSATFQLPPVLLSKISDESCKSKESCWAVNFIFYFLFRELKNSEAVRRWVLRKLALEFDELLASSVLGKFFSSIAIQNIDLGQNFPVVNWLRTTKVELHPVFKSISTLDILLDLDYAGGFQFSIQAESHLKHSAFLSIQFNEVKGQARLQFSSEPYAHWSFSFSENPEIDISVVSQLYGKSFHQVTAIIAAQLKRSVRKKHTLPMYKIRYKPFFARVQPFLAAVIPSAAPRIETAGTLSITLVECRSLMQSLLRGSVFATVGIANFDWVAAYDSGPRRVYLVRDVGIVKTAKREAKLDFRMIQQGDVPVVEAVESAISVRSVMNMISFNSTDCELEPGDEIIAVDGKRVSTIKQCIKYFRSSRSVRVVWRIRRNYLLGRGDNPDEEEVPDTNAATIQGEQNGVASCLQSNGSQSQASSRRNSFVGESPLENFSLRSQPSNNYRLEQLFKTKSLPACRDPIFQECFAFALEETHQFINFTCWSSEQSASSETSAASTPAATPVKRPKAVPATCESLPFGRDAVLGSLVIPLADVISECATTGMGFFVKDFYLGPPDVGAGEARENELKGHSGFEPTMCYGKVTLSFQFKSVEDPKRKQSSDTVAGMQFYDPGETSGVGDGSQLSPGEEPQSHRFVRTHFRSSAVCDYCNKKIWLKEAYTCELCSMKCHKKCHERCLANTICRREIHEHGKQGNPEIITTESEPQQVPLDTNTEEVDGAEAEVLLQPTGSSNNTRRRTLGGLIASAVQIRTTQLKRAGSATTLLAPSIPVSSTVPGSKSLPPSPDASPVNSRKASARSQLKNPFEALDPSGSGYLSQENLNMTVENLIQLQNEDLVSLAKESGRELYRSHSVPDRKKKLNSMLTRLQEEIDKLTLERQAWTKDETSQMTTRSEEKVQALALLMFHYCAGLQNVHDLEEAKKDEIEKKAAASASYSPFDLSPAP